MAYADVVNALSPTAYWRCGEASGLTLYDETANSYDAVASTGDVTVGATSLISESGNTAATVGTNNGAILNSAATDAIFSNGSGSIKAHSFAGWIQKSSNCSNGYFDTIVDSYYYFTFGVTTTGTLRVGVGGAAVTTTATIPLDEPVFVTYSYNGVAEVKISINGVMETLDSGTASSTYASGGAIGGYYGGNGYALNGQMDEFAFFDGVLTQDDIDDLYAAGTEEAVSDEGEFTCAGTSTATFETIPQTGLVDGYFRCYGRATATFYNAFADILSVDIAGTSTAVFVGEDTQDRDFICAGSSQFIAFMAPQILEITATLAGTSTATFVGEDTQDADFTCAGSSTAVFTSAVSTPSEFTCRGSSAADFRSENYTDIEFLCRGSSTAYFDGPDTTDTRFIMAGKSSAKFVAAPIQSRAFVMRGTSDFRARADDPAPNYFNDMEFSCPGSSTALWESATVFSSVFSASGSSSASFIPASWNSAELTISGTSTATFEMDLHTPFEFTCSASSVFTPELELLTTTPHARVPRSQPDIFITTKRIL